MLSYRHAFHAGNFADVLKHTALVALIIALRRKEKPFFYLDTHAGIGHYDLHTSVAQKTAEWQAGIGVLWQAQDAPAAVADYLRQVQAFNADGQLRHYPGSPGLVQPLLREKDRMRLCELHPRDVELLQQSLAGERRAQIGREDGFAALKSALPPVQRRGLVLIDPPYEVKTDYQTVAAALQQGLQRFATGMYAIWYPVLERKQVEKMLAAITDVARASGAKSVLVVEQCLRPDEQMGMTGSGMVVINPPWQFDQQMLDALEWLLPRLTNEPAQGHNRLQWLLAEGD